MIPGDVLYWPEFEFPDGDEADKLLIVVSTQRNGIQLVFKTTSKSGRHRKNQEGCHHKEGYFFISAKTNWFKRDTWVVLNSPLELSASELEDAHVCKRAKHIQSLKDELIRAIVNCFLKTDDWTQNHKWLLGQR